MLLDIRGMFSIALSLFIVMNSFGNASLFMHLLKGIPHARQKKIVLRELIIALFIIILFNFIGQALLQFLHISEDTVQIAGGVVLFLLSLKMLFPPEEEGQVHEIPEIDVTKIKEPFIVPLALPLVAGPAVLAAVMLYAQQQPSSIIMIGSIVLAWLASLGVLILSSHLSQWLGEKGMVAIERLMGFIMVLIAINMFMDGIKAFLKS